MPCGKPAAPRLPKRPERFPGGLEDESPATRKPGPSPEVRNPYLDGCLPEVSCGMKGYGQFCSIVRALDLLGERFTLLIVRELLSGSPGWLVR